MAAQTKESPKQTEPKLEQQKTSEAKQTAEKDVKTLQTFWTKFNNDWVMNFAAGLAFNLITAIFPIAIAIIVIASSIPALVQSILQATPVSQIPGNGFIFSAIGILIALLIAWVLFEAIFIVVPNQHISFRNSWRGAVVSAVALEVYLYLFPFYVAHFLSNATG